MKKSSWKKNKTAPKQKQPQLVTSPAAFEAAFENRIGMSPEEWIRIKIGNGSKKEDVEYLYELCAAEIEHQSNCMSQPFDRYFDQAQAFQKRDSAKIAPLRNAGKPWTETEDNKLEDEFDAGVPINAIAKEHGRTVGAIESRLVRLGKLEKREN